MDMKIHIKDFRNLFLILSLSLAASGVQAAGETKDKPDQQADVQNESARSSQPDWKKIYSTNSYMTFDKGLMGIQNGVYSSHGGAPGNSGNVLLRGINTTNLNASPYVVVDGVLVKMARNINPFASGFALSNTAFINPLDVADVRILQSGYNSVLYGGRASNGVIDLTTNKGVAGSTSIDIVARVGFQQADYNKMEMMGGEDFRSYLFDYMHNMGNTIVDLQQMNIFNAGHPKYNHSTDWLDMVKRNAMFQDYQVKMSGGDGDTRYMFGVGYSSQEGTIDPTAYNRFNMRINLDYKISQKISIANYLAYSYGTSRFYDQGNNWAVHPLYVALTKAPFLSPMYYDDNGIATTINAGVDELGKSNPAMFKSNLQNKGTDNRVDGMIRANWAVAPRTAVSTSLSISYVNSIEDLRRLAEGIAPDEYRKRQNAKRTYSDYILRWNTWAERTGSFLGNGSWHGKAGFIVENEEEKSAYGRRVNASTDDFESLGYGDVDSISNMNYKQNFLSFYAEAGVRYWDRVSLDGRIYVEGSSNFGPKGRWGIYGGLNLGVDVLKLDKYYLGVNASWGRVGNNDIRGSYQHTLYYPTHYLAYGGVYLGNVANKKLKPEITNNYEGGIKARLIDRIDVYAGYYYKKTTGMLTQKSLPIEIGLDPQFENNGDVINQGFEFSLNANVIRNQKWNWKLFANISTLKNKVKHLNNGDIIREYDKFSSILRQDEALGSFYGYKIQGIYNTSSEVDLKRADGTLYLAGDYKMEDINEDGIINAKDMQVIGSPLPDFYGGFGTRLNFTGIELSMLFTYSYGNDVYNLFNQHLSSMSDLSVPVAAAKGRWISETLPGKGELPRAAYNDPSGNFNASNKWVEDGSYLKLKTLSLAYDIPLKKRSGFLKGLKVFANCNNLFTVTGYSGLDPEVFLSNDPMLRGVDTGGAPNPRSYVFGVNISL